MKDYALRMPDILSQSVRTYFQVSFQGCCFYYNNQIPALLPADYVRQGDLIGGCLRCPPCACCCCQRGFETSFFCVCLLLPDVNCCCHSLTCEVGSTAALASLDVSLSFAHGERAFRGLTQGAYSGPGVLCTHQQTLDSVQCIAAPLQDDVHVVLPLVPERGQALSNSERFAAFGSMVAAAIQYPFSTQEVVVDGECVSDDEMQPWPPCMQ